MIRFLQSDFWTRFHDVSMSRALLEAIQWSELLLIFLVQAFADIESRALLALIIISLRLDSS